MKKLLQLLTLATLLTQSLSAGKIHDAVVWGKLDEVAQLISEDPSCVNARGEHGYTPLNLAIMEGNKNIVEFLLANGADVHARHSGNNWTPLQIAEAFGYEQIAELLRQKITSLNELM